MANPLSTKTFKIELEFTVSMDELRQDHLRERDSESHFLWLKNLQQALIHHEPLLVRQMLAMVAGKIQEYADYLAARDEINPLMDLAESLEPEDSSENQLSKIEFANRTRALRVGCMSVRLAKGEISEKLTSPAAETVWKPVWRDLIPESKLGRELEKFSVPSTQVHTSPNTESGHYLRVRYLGRQGDQVVIEAICTCQECMSGIGEDETQALQALWESYKNHRQKATVGWKIQSRLKDLFRKTQINKS